MIPTSDELLTTDELKMGMDFFALMTTSRLIEDRVHSLYRQSRLRGRVISGRGQEAIPVGSTYCLDPDDVVAPVHRDLGAHLARGTTPLTVFEHYFGRATGPSRGRDGDIHFGEWSKGVFPMVSHLPDSWAVVAGISLSFRLRNQERVALAFCGDGASSTGTWHEALNFCSVFQTPAVFVIENNQYAYSTPTKRQFRVEQLSSRAASYGIPGITVDGNDVYAVHRVVAESVRRAREGGGPTLIEAMTMRIDGHAIHDGAHYVPPDLIESWRRRDPIDVLRQRLIENDVPSESLSAIVENCWTDVDLAVDQAHMCDSPDPRELLDGVYSERRRDLSR